MSERTTSVEVAGSGYLMHGHVSYAEAVIACRRMYQWQLEEALRVIKAIDSGDAKVFHQRGVHVKRDRREVPPFAAGPGEAS